MRPTSWPFAVSPFRRLALLSLLALVAHPAPVARAGWFSADPTYLGYRIPEHRVSQWIASLDGSASRSASAVGFGSEFRSGSVNGRLGTRATWAFDSDPLAYGWSFTTDVYGERSRYRSSFSMLPRTSHNDELAERLSQRFTLDGSVRSYPWPAPIGLALTMTHVLELRQEFESRQGRDLDPPSEQRTLDSRGAGARNYLGAFSAGVGLGRVRDATPVFQAQVLEARLLKSGALSRALSPDARQKLAALFSVQVDVSYAHERPGKYFWRELERVLREDGALSPGALDAHDVQRLLEPLTIATRVVRRVGWFVGPAVTIITQRNRTSLEESTSILQLISGSVVFADGTRFEEVRNDRRDIVFSGFVAEVHRPLGPRWQAEVSSTSSLSEAGEFLSVGSTAAASYIVSDRWLASLRLGHVVSAPGHALERRVLSWNINLNGSLHYFLEDSWALGLTAGERQDHSPFGFRRAGSVHLGITYVVSGLFSAPGLVDIMRRTPPTP